MGFGVWGVGFGISGLGFRIKGLGSGFRVQGSGFRFTSPVRVRVDFIFEPKVQSQRALS